MGVLGTLLPGKKDNKSSRKERDPKKKKKMGLTHTPPPIGLIWNKRKGNKRRIYRSGAKNGRNLKGSHTLSNTLSSGGLGKKTLKRSVNRKSCTEDYTIDGKGGDGKLSNGGGKQKNARTAGIREGRGEVPKKTRSLDMESAEKKICQERRWGLSEKLGI